MYELELFAGAGGGILGKNLLGFTTVGAVEIEPYCRRVLLARQKDLCCPMFPIWDDVTTFRVDNDDCRAYIQWLQEIKDDLCISGGFPCQDISASGKGAGSAAQSPGCGQRWPGLLARFNRDSCSWKIPRCSRLAGSATSSLRWPRWGIMQDGVCWELDISDTPLSETACGYWGNITRTMAGWMRPTSKMDAFRRATYGAQRQSVLCQLVIQHSLWPTVSLVEMLMGWPDQWTALEPLATDKFRQWQHSHGGC